MFRGLVWYCTTAALAAGLLVGSVGCGGASATGGSEQEAHDALTKALDAWKSGRKADEMRNESPEVIVGDPDWKKGSRLTAYQIGSGVFDGKNLRVPVTLTVEQRPRGQRKVIVDYIVGIRPVVTLFRDGE
jgi:Ni/Co efflux regulator RcnB